MEQIIVKSNDISSNSKENIKDSSAEIERLHLLLNESINKLDNILKKFDGAEIIKEIYRSGLAYDEGNSRSSNRLPPAFGRSNIIKIERLAILKEKGRCIPTTDDMVSIHKAASQVLELDALYEIGMVSSKYENGRDIGYIKFTDNKNCAIPEYVPGKIDIFEYIYCKNSRNHNDSQYDKDMFQRILKSNNWVEEYGLKGVSDSLQQDKYFGFSLSNLISALLRALKIIGRKDLQEMSLELFYSKMLNGNKSKSLKNAIQYLMYPPRKIDLDIAKMRPNGTRHQPARLVTQPFLVYNNKVYLNGNIILHSITRWMRYMVNGDWPIPESIRSSNFLRLNESLKEYRNTYNLGRGKMFEKYFQDSIKELNIIPWVQVKKGYKFENSCVKMRREVNSFVVDYAKSEIWVLDMKDNISDQNALSIYHQLQDIHTYNEKLKITVDDISDSKCALTHFSCDIVNLWAKNEKIDKNISDSILQEVRDVKDWNIRRGIIIRDQHPGEFINDELSPKIMRPDSFISYLLK